MATKQNNRTDPAKGGSRIVPPTTMSDAQQSVELEPGKQRFVRGREVTLSTGAKVAVFEVEQRGYLLRFRLSTGEETRVVLSDEAFSALTALAVYHVKMPIFAA